MKFKKLTYLILSITFLSACSTKKNTWVNRNFNSLTAHYNGYWAANEMVKESEENIFTKYKDNYEKILPIFTYTTIDEGKAITPEMEKAFKKASKVIRYHSMLIRDVEYNPYIKNTYLLIGKTHFHKHDYFAGLEAFEYVVNKNKKNPYKFEAMMWMLRTYNETGLFSSSQGLIDLILDEKKFPKKYKSEFNAIVADFYLKQEDYPKTIEFLEPAFKLCKKRKFKGRYAFILAQLYKQLGDASNAIKYYEKSLKFGPSYDMEFNASLNLTKAKAFAGGNADETKKLLQKMLSQDKYKEYYDQIYYSLAEIAEIEKSSKEQETYLIKSVQISTLNKNQKGLSSLKAGELYFSQAKYELAQVYYDTAVTYLNKDYPDFSTVQNKQRSLKTLVGYTKTINVEDSMQKVSKLTLEQQLTIIGKIIDENKKKQAEQKKLLEEQKSYVDVNSSFQDNMSIGAMNFGGGPQLGAVSAQWYYYNPATISFGYSEFQKKWGNRKLEDNWRRSNKPIVASEELQQNNDEIVTEEIIAPVPLVELTAEELDAIETNKYLKNIPTSPEQLTASTNKIVDAYYNCGTLYKEQLNDLKNAASTFENLQKDFPNNKYNIVTNYQLYRIFLAMPDEKKAEFYKEIILGKYPDSEYASLIKNPDFNSKNKSKNNKDEQYYEETYNLFLLKNYSSVIQRCAYADTLFPKSFLKPKYALLHALCIGPLENIKAMKAELKKITVEFSSSLVSQKAIEILAILESNSSFANLDSESKKMLFTKDESEEHFYVLQMPMSADLNKIKAGLAKFIDANFGSLGLNVDDMIFDETKKMVLVKGLENATKALTFYDLIKDNISVFSSLTTGGYQQMVISKNNFNILMKNQKEYETYATFFKENYLKI